VSSLLRILEQKIDLIGHAVLAKETDLAEQPTRKVSLSASGLAFLSERGFNLGSTLELKMVLPPALVGIVAHGRVVQCRPAGSSDQGYHVAVDFVGLRETDRELLIRHIVKRQTQQLRERKRASE
jgi:c-di-GMP-binding flagellar brake protein YcgR